MNVKLQHITMNIEVLHIHNYRWLRYCRWANRVVLICHGGRGGCPPSRWHYGRVKWTYGTAWHTPYSLINAKHYLFWQQTQMLTNPSLNPRVTATIHADTMDWLPYSTDPFVKNKLEQTLAFFLRTAQEKYLLKSWMEISKGKPVLSERLSFPCQGLRALR